MTNQPGAAEGRISLQRRIQRSLPYSLAFAGVQLVLSLVSLLLLVRYLPPPEYGVWALLTALASPIDLLISFGYPNFITRFLPARDDARGVADVVWRIVVVRLLLATVLCALLLLGFELFAERFELQDHFRSLLVFQVAVVFNIGSVYLRRVLDARFMQRDVLFLTLANQILIVGGTVTGIQLGRPLHFFVELMAAVAVFHFGLCALAFGWSHGLPRLAQLVRRVAETREERRYRRASYVADYGATLLNTDVDRYLVGFLATNVQVAIYSVATTVVQRLQFFLPVQLFRPLMEATFFRRYEETGDTAEIDRMFRFLFKTNALVSFYLVALFVPLGYRLLAFVFREGYGAAYWAITIYLVSTIFRQLPSGMTLKALKRAEALIYAQVAIVANVALGIPLVMHWGATGMALATASSLMLKQLIMYGFTKRRMEIRIPWWATAKCALAAFAAAGVLAGAGERVPLVLGLGLGTGVYLVLIRLLEPMNEDDRHLLRRIMPPRLHGLVPVFLGRV